MTADTPVPLARNPSGPPLVAEPIPHSCRSQNPFRAATVACSPIILHPSSRHGLRRPSAFSSPPPAAVRLASSSRSSLIILHSPFSFLPAGSRPGLHAWHASFCDAHKRRPNRWHREGRRWPTRFLRDEADLTRPERVWARLFGAEQAVKSPSRRDRNALY